MAKIFLSYRREDSTAYVHLLDRRLRDRFSDDDVYMDVRSIKPGQDFIDSIVSSVESSDILVAVIGEDWLGRGLSGADTLLHTDGDFVRLEIRTALESGIRVIPVLVAGAAMPGSEDLPSELQPLLRLNAFSLTDARLDEDATRLATNIQSLLGSHGWQRPEIRRYLTAGAIFLLLVFLVSLFWASRKHQEVAENAGTGIADSSTSPAMDTEATSSIESSGDGGLMNQIEPTGNKGPYVQETRITFGKPPATAYDAGIWSMAFSPNGRWLATAEARSEAWYEYPQSDGIVRLWDLETGEKSLELKVSQDRRCEAVSFFGNSMLVAACEGGSPGLSSQTVRVWSLPEGEILRTLLAVDPVDGNQPIRFVGTSKEKDSIIAIGGPLRHDAWPRELPATANMRVWKGETGTLETALVTDLGDADPTLSPDRDLILVPGYRALALWRVSDGEVLNSFPEIRLDIDSVAFSADGEHIIIASSKHATPLLLWVESSTGNVTQSVSLPDAIGNMEIQALVLSPDGQFSVVLVGWKVLLLDLDQGTILQQLEYPNSRITIRMSDDGKRLAIAAHQTGVIDIYSLSK